VEERVVVLALVADGVTDCDGEAVPVMDRDAMLLAGEDAVPVTVEDAVPVAVEDAVPVVVEDAVPVRDEDAVPVAVEDAVSDVEENIEPVGLTPVLEEDVGRKVLAGLTVPVGDCVMLGVAHGPAAYTATLSTSSAVGRVSD
jgi:hypothetical protein